MAKRMGRFQVGEQVDPRPSFLGVWVPVRTGAQVSGAPEGGASAADAAFGEQTGQQAAVSVPRSASCAGAPWPPAPPPACLKDR